MQRQKTAAADEATSKPTATPSEDVNYWVERFGSSTGADAESDDPFPPGYGDDVADADK